VPVIRIERMTYRYKAVALPAKPARRAHYSPSVAYLDPPESRLPPEGFLGGSGLAGAGSAAGDLGLRAARPARPRPSPADASANPGRRSCRAGLRA